MDTTTWRAVDTHVHLESYVDPAEELRLCRDRGVLPVIATTRPSEYRRVAAAYAGCDGVRVGLGLHPEAAGSVYAESEMAIMRSLFGQATWISEVGLDAVIASAVGSFFGAGPSLGEQEQVLEEIVSLGVSDKAMSVHSRGAESRVCEVLERAAPGGAVFHWYRGDRTTAARVVEAGFLLSVNVEMVHDHDLADLLRWLPSDSLALETDGPFTARSEGGWSRPSDVADTLTDLARLRGDDPDGLARTMMDNVARIEPVSSPGAPRSTSGPNQQ